MANKVQFGLKNFHIAPLTFTTNTSYPGSQIPSFSTYTWIPGAVSISINPEGDATPFYADDMIYYVSEVNNGYTGTIELAYIRPSDAQLIWGDVVDGNGVHIETAYRNESKHFAMAFEFMNDSKHTRYVYYDVVFERPAINGSTTTNVKEPQTTTLNFRCVPLPVGLTGTGGMNIRATKTDATVGTATDTVYGNWFDNVWYIATPYTPSP